jgi:hypothetical protein
MNLAPFTRRLEECRKRWHRRTVQYVLEVARIVRGARKAARDERRWGEWIRNETHMNRTTVYRYLQVAKFLKANVDSKHQLVSLSIAKIYALSRMEPGQVLSLLKSGKLERMSDVSFLRMARRFRKDTSPRFIRSNLFKSLDSAFGRLEESMKRWQHSELPMPPHFQMKYRSKILTLSRILERIGKAGAVAV